jgi:hypothetical protein
MEVHRITNGSTVSGWGPMVELMFAHDFESRSRPGFFLEVEFKASLLGGGGGGDGAAADMLSATLLAGVKLR